MLREFLAWWMEQLRSLLPARMTRQDGPASALVVEPAPGGGVLLARRDRRESELGRFGPSEAGTERLRRALQRGLPLVLRVPPAQLLEREAALPLAAERDLGNALRYGLDSMTPFAADEVFWDWTVIERDRRRGRLRLRLSLVPRAPLRPLLAALERAGAAVRLLEVRLPPTGSGAGTGADELRVFVPDGGAEGHRPRRSVVAAGVLCAALACVAAALPFVQQARRLDAADARIAALRPRVAQAEALRRRIADEADNADVVARERARVGDALAVIATLTQVLPDDTWLSELTLRDRRLLIAGESARAAGLIGLLSAEPGLRDPSFAAPITRSPNGAGDLFSIQAELAP